MLNTSHVNEQKFCSNMKFLCFTDEVRVSVNWQTPHHLNNKTVGASCENYISKLLFQRSLTMRPNEFCLARFTCLSLSNHLVLKSSQVALFDTPTFTLWLWIYWIDGKNRLVLYTFTPDRFFSGTRNLRSSYYAINLTSFIYTNPYLLLKTM